MPALTNRQAARERVLQIAQAIVDRVIPAEEEKSLKGSTFADFEQQVCREGNEMLTVLMEERAKLEPNAQVVVAGRCPHCGSLRTYLENGAQQREIRAPSGMVVYSRQEARCRGCGGSFSPSGARLGVAG
jgi:hypothetical protein